MYVCMQYSCILMYLHVYLKISVINAWWDHELYLFSSLLFSMLPEIFTISVITFIIRQ